MFFNRKFCDPLLVEDAMCADYLLLFAQTTGVVKGLHQYFTLSCSLLAGVS